MWRGMLGMTSNDDDDDYDGDDDDDDYKATIFSDCIYYYLQ